MENILSNYERMGVDRIDDLRALVGVVECGSLTGAARKLRRSLQSISRSLAAVERDVGVELVRRTTRRSSPTEAGLAFYHRISAALEEIESARAEASNRQLEPSGQLRLTASAAFATLYLVPVITEFLTTHPEVEIDLELSDRYVDLVADDVDLAVRIGKMPDSTMKTRGIADLRRVVFGAPSYFARRGRPETPGDLLDHQCIVRTASRDGNAWPFTVKGRLTAVKVAGRFQTNGAPAASAAAALGFGIANAPLWQVRPLIDRGEVELVLTKFEPPPVPLRAIWPATRVLPAKTQLFINFLAERLRAAQL